MLTVPALERVVEHARIMLRTNAVKREYHFLFSMLKPPFCSQGSLHVSEIYLVTLI